MTLVIVELPMSKKRKPNWRVRDDFVSDGVRYRFVEMNDRLYVVSDISDSLVELDCLGDGVDIEFIPWEEGE